MQSNTSLNIAASVVVTLKKNDVVKLIKDSIQIQGFEPASVNFVITEQCDFRGEYYAREVTSVEVTMRQKYTDNGGYQR